MAGALSSPDLLALALEALSAVAAFGSGATMLVRGGAVPLLAELLATAGESGSAASPRAAASPSVAEHEQQQKEQQQQQQEEEQQQQQHRQQGSELRFAAAALSRLARAPALRGPLLRAGTLGIAARRLVQFTPFVLAPPALPPPPPDALPDAPTSAVRRLAAEVRGWALLRATAWEATMARVAVVANCAACVAQLAHMPAARNWLLQQPLRTPLACVDACAFAGEGGGVSGGLLSFRVALQQGEGGSTGVAPASARHADVLLTALLSTLSSAPASAQLIADEAMGAIPGAAAASPGASILVRRPALSVDGALANACAVLAALVEEPAFRAKLGARSAYRALVALLEGVTRASDRHGGRPIGRAALVRLSVARNGAAVLAALTRDISARRPLGGAGAARAVVGLLLQEQGGFSADAAVRCASAEALANCARDEWARPALFDGGGVAPLVALCMRRAEGAQGVDDRTVAHAATALARLAGGSSGMRLATAAKGGALYALTEAQRRLGANAGAAFTGLLADAVGALIEHRSRLTEGERREMLDVLTPDERRGGGGGRNAGMVVGASELEGDDGGGWMGNAGAGTSARAPVTTATAPPSGVPVAVLEAGMPPPPPPQRQQQAPPQFSISSSSAPVVAAPVFGSFGDDDPL